MDYGPSTMVHGLQPNRAKIGEKTMFGRKKYSEVRADALEIFVSDKC
jgi:hypothetical protein